MMIPLPTYERATRQRWRHPLPKEVPKFKCTHTMTGAEYKTYITPIVYAWRRGNEWMYVGCSIRGFQRLTESTHYVLSKQSIWDTDIIQVMSNLNERRALQLEKYLIEKYRPLHNR